MKKVLYISMLAFSCLAFGQKVKIKKDKVFIDDKETYHIETNNYNFILSDVKDNGIVSVLGSTYEVRKTPPIYPNESPYWTKIIYTVRFLKNNKELVTDLSDKDIIKNIYKSGIFDENGNADEAKIDLFIAKYSNEDLKIKLFK
ncbi:hypothetical protein NZD88_19235 [Chryseobacterium antibioticum]|uniref:Uncharacterized protein n=1 Tax=Chryseobacterium pyrolae TaxID=2987481 RepID=A0ABT2ILZ6_9FLAO|nr:hypothetical protein [Chryseobacterium pyrolae]MCT2409692.1 hypothetical protein [Chryseobacterium pyrolae]